MSTMLRNDWVLVLNVIHVCCLIQYCSMTCEFQEGHVIISRARTNQIIIFYVPWGEPNHSLPFHATGKMSPSKRVISDSTLNLLKRYIYVGNYVLKILPCKL